MGNIGTVLSGAASGAAAGGSIGGIYGYLGGGLLGGVAGAFSDSSSSSANTLSMHDMYNLEMYNTAKNLFMMNEQNKYNTSNMRYQTDLQHELNKQAFDYNNYFLDNAYQKSVNSMRAAGLNPLLLAGNSPSVGSASAGSSSALGVQQGSHGIDPASMLSASANSAQAKIAKGQLALNTASTVGDVAMKNANSALMSEQAKTEANKRQNYDADTLLKSFQSVRQSIENSNLDEKMKAEITKDIATAESSMMMARYYDFIKDFQAYNYVHSANAQESQASASHRSAGAQEQIAGAQKRRLNAESVAQEIENQFNLDHPGVYGTSKVLHAIGPLVSLVGTGMIAKGLGVKGKPQPNVNKEVIMKPPSGFQYGN